MLHVAEQVVDAFRTHGVDKLFRFVVPLTAALGSGAFVVGSGFVDSAVEDVLFEVVGVYSIVEFAQVGVT